MMQIDLLNWQPPAHPPETSQIAGRKVGSKSQLLRLQCLEYIKTCDVRGSTPDEAAKALGEDILNIRPRFSELKEMGLIADSGMRRVNDKGNTQGVYVSARMGELA